MQEIFYDLIYFASKANIYTWQACKCYGPWLRFVMTHKLIFLSKKKKKKKKFRRQPWINREACMTRKKQIADGETTARSNLNVI